MINISKKYILPAALALGLTVNVKGEEFNPGLMVQATKAEKVPLLFSALECKPGECQHLAIEVSNASVDTTGYRVTIYFRDPQGVKATLMIDREFTKIARYPDSANYINLWKVMADDVYKVKVEEVKDGRSGTANTR